MSVPSRHPAVELTWRRSTGTDLPAVARLARAVLAADGGSDYATDGAFLGRWYGAPDAYGRVGVDGAGVVRAAGAVRPDDGYASLVGMVAPTARGQGHGSTLLDWSLGVAEEAGLVPQVETEWTTGEAERLYAARPGAGIRRGRPPGTLPPPLNLPGRHGSCRGGHAAHCAEGPTLVRLPTTSTTCATASSSGTALRCEPSR